MRHRFFRVVAVGLVGTAGCTVANCANGAFLVNGFVLDASRTAAAQATAAAGNDVYLMYATFTDPGDLFLNIFNVNIDFGSTLYQAPGGGDLAPDDFIIGLFPETAFDSFITVGGLDDVAAPAGSVSFDGNGVTFSSTGIINNSGWFTTPPTGLGVPQFNAVVSAAFGFNIYAVVLGQFTVAQGSRVIINGDFTLTWNDPSGATSTQTGSDMTGDLNNGGFFVIEPAPSAMALFGLAGLTATRRRRA